MNHSLNSLKGVILGIILGTTIGVIKGDTRSLDYGSYTSCNQEGLGQQRPGSSAKDLQFPLPVLYPFSILILTEGPAILT